MDKVYVCLDYLAGYQTEVVKVVDSEEKAAAWVREVQEQNYTRTVGWEAFELE